MAESQAGSAGDFSDGKSCRRLYGASCPRAGVRARVASCAGLTAGRVGRLLDTLGTVPVVILSRALGLSVAGGSRRVVFLITGGVRRFLNTRRAVPVIVVRLTFGIFLRRGRSRAVFITTVAARRVWGLLDTRRAVPVVVMGRAFGLLVTSSRRRGGPVLMAVVAARRV